MEKPIVRVFNSIARLSTNKYLTGVLKYLVPPLLAAILGVWFGFFLANKSNVVNDNSLRILWKDKINQLNIICRNNLEGDLITEYEKVLSKMVLKTEQDRHAYGIIKLQLGYVYMSIPEPKKDYELAIYNFKEADNMIEMDNPTIRSQLYGMLGDCYYQIGISNRDTSSFNEGHKYFSRALSYQHEIDQNLVANIYLKFWKAVTSRQLIYYYNDYYSVAMDAISEIGNFQKANLDIDDELVVQSHVQLGRIYMNLFSLSQNEQFLDSSKLYFEKAIDLINLEKQTSLYNSILMDISGLYIGYANTFQDSTYIKKSLLTLSTLIDRIDSISQPRLFNLTKLNLVAVQYQFIEKENERKIKQLENNISLLREYFVSIMDEQSIAACYALQFQIYFHEYVILNDESAYDKALEIYTETNRELSLCNDKQQFAYFKYNASILFARKFNSSKNDLHLKEATECYEEASKYSNFPWPTHISDYRKFFTIEIDSNMIKEFNDTSWHTIMEISF